MRKDWKRDAGLTRLSAANRLLAAGALVMAGVLSAAAAKSLPGRSSASSVGGSGASSPNVAPTSGSFGSTAQAPGYDDGGFNDNAYAGYGGGGLLSPGGAPSPSAQAPVAVSGGS